MKWKLIQPHAGDMIRVKFKEFYHYGIFVSDGEVIQFGLAPWSDKTVKHSEIEVCTSDIDDFLCGGFLEVAVFDFFEKRKNRSADEIISFARKRLGERGYSIIHNNCEHFVYDCVTGKPYCSQTSDVRALFQSFPVVDVFVARIHSQPETAPLSCSEREAEISEISNEKTRIEKYYVWKLLEYALERSFGMKAHKMTFTKTETGKWTTDKCFFSLSHCDGAVAVVTSRTAVGVDIEKERPTLKERFADKILTEAEHGIYSQTPTEEQELFLLEKWTAKESLFKKDGKKTFIPAEYDTLTSKHHTRKITLAEDDYVLSVATDTPDIIRFYTDIDLSVL